MKRIFIVLAGVGLLLLFCLFACGSASAVGQRWFLKMDGDEVAHFSFKEGQQSYDTLYMEGVIYANTLKDVKKVLKKHPEVKVLVMIEVPGSIDDEMNLEASKVIRAHGISTYIPENGMVASGGTDMFLAGVHRTAHATAKIGVHSWGGGSQKAIDLPKGHEEHKKYLEYYKEVGIPAAFYWYTLEAAAADDIHWMLPHEIEKYQVTTEGEELLAVVKTLASDEYRGRGTEDNLKTQDYIRAYYSRNGVKSFNSNYEQPFTFINEKNNKESKGVNLVGYIQGKEIPDKYIVIGAHYDHLGVINDTIYNGADDNASGTAALLLLAKYFKMHQPRHSIIFAAFDAEELGLHGSKHFVASSPVSLDAIKLNINFDMISRNPHNEIYVVGTHQYPNLKPIIALSHGKLFIKVSYGHDNPEDTTKDYWMNSSDNAPFFHNGIPNITFSEEDHADYHQATDDFENINPEFYKQVYRFIKSSIINLDQEL